MRLRLFSLLLIAFSFVAMIAHGAEWQSNYEQAMVTAKEARKCVLLDFTGSDWCGPCIEMNKVVFSKAAFVSYAQKNLILVEVDYPMHKTLPEKIAKQNGRLMHQYGIDRTGYPTVILLNPDGKILGKLEGYNGQRPAEVIAWVEKLRGKLR